MEEDKQQRETAAAPGTKGIRGRYKLLVLLLILICAWFAIRWWIRGKTHIETDNAFVETKIVSLSTKVPGTVKRVLVNDNQFVKQGDLLVELDQSDYRVQVNKAEAGVGMARNETGGEYKKAEGARATVQLAKARLDQARLDLARNEELFRLEVVAREQIDRLKTEQRIAESQYKAAEEGLNQLLAEAGLESGGGKRAKVLQRQAQLEEAQLQLSYTRITAPADGYITRKSVEPGANVQANQPLMALVPLQGVWITANYKEGQLAYIRTGQKVEFSVDAYPNRTFRGRVDSIMAGTGAIFSVLPPENATGNFVKVVQRVPVKIVIDNNSDPNHLLRAGMSVQPTVLLNRTAKDVLKELNPFK
jgi:membrane fusion protein, multidrug efflux system